MPQQYCWPYMHTNQWPFLISSSRFCKRSNKRLLASFALIEDEVEGVVNVDAELLARLGK